MTTFTGGGVDLFQMVVVRSAVKLEGHGMKVNRGVNATRDWAKHYGLKGSTTKVRPALLARLDEEIEKLRAALKPGDITP